MKEFNEKLFNFIEYSTCSFTCIEEIKRELIKQNYIELYENEKWDFKVGKYFVIRNDASIIAFSVGEKHNECFNIICAHSDTPGFSLKPNSEIYENNYLKLNVAPYGGILNYGWLDRPLSIAGRVIYKEKDTTTDSVSLTIFKKICKMANIPYQNYSSRNDMATGSTLAGLCIRHVSVDSIDVGIPQLAMYSANEIVGSDDTFSLYKTFKKFYDVSIERNKDIFLIKEKGR